MGVTLSAVMSALEAVAPLGLAEPWDRPGLQVGDPGATVEAVLVALDPSPAAVAQAALIGAQLLVTHHPLLLDPLPQIDLSTPQGRLIRRCLGDGIAIYSAHTNLDRAEGGVNDRLAERLGLLGVEPLGRGEPQVKLVVTVPVGYEPAVLRALTRVGAGRIGRYAGCSFGCRGRGAFEPLGGANPFLGRAGSREEVAETRLEAVVVRSRIAQVRAAVLEAHPYEEVALDLYPLEGAGSTGGLGRIGTLAEPRELGVLAEEIGRRLEAPGVHFVGDPRARVERVAVCGGSGASLWREAQRAGAQVLVTGDVKYHSAREAEAAGFALVDAGHAATEAVSVDCLATTLTAWASGADLPLRVEAFREPDPLRWVVPAQHPSQTRKRLRRVSPPVHEAPQA